MAIRVLADLCTLLLAFAVSYALYRALVMSGLWAWHQPPSPLPYVRIAFTFAGITLVVFWHVGLYRSRASILNLWELKTAVQGMAMSAAFFFALLFFLKLEGYSRANVLTSIGLSTFCIVIQRRVLCSVLRSMRLRGRLGWRTLIYGCGDTGQLVMKKLVQGSHHDSLVVGFLDDVAPIGSIVSCRITQTGAELFEARVLGRSEDISNVAREYSVSELLVTSTMGPVRLAEVLATCRSCGVEVGIVPHSGSGRADQFVVEDLCAIPVLRKHNAPTRPVFLFAKRGLDVTIAALALLVTLPLLCLAAIAISLDSAGGVLFTQERVGLRGRRFRMYKLRTMSADTAAYALSPIGDIDTRITRAGRLLRVGGIDELPQLLNVLKGEMSLVGPRPEMPFIVATYTELEQKRLTVKPGITGLWQISADRHSQIHENIEYDLYYLNNQSFLLDVLILVETAFFTCGTVLGMVMRLGRPTMPAGGEHSATVSATVIRSPSRAANGHVLIALDQRRSDSRCPPSWELCLPVACDLSNRWPMKVLAAGENRIAFDAILQDPLRKVVMPRLEYVTDWGGGELQSLISEASVVVTDLGHLAKRARESGVGVLPLHDLGRVHMQDDSAEVLEAFMAGLGRGVLASQAVAPDSLLTAFVRN